jgi:cytochrome c biogenesis protein CcdA
MIGAAFAEAVGSLMLPCSWTLVAPAFLAAAAGRWRYEVVAATAAGSMLAGAGRLAGWPTAPDVLLGLVMAAAFLGLGSRPRAAAIASGGAVGAVAAMVWTPCVGPELGAILSADSSPATLAGIAAFMAGSAVPAVALVLVRRLVPPAPGRRSRVAWAASLLGVGLGALVAVGLHLPVVSLLAEWSTT